MEKSVKEWASLAHDLAVHLGRWLDSRKAESDQSVHVDLKHIDRSTFEFVLRYLKEWASLAHDLAVHLDCIVFELNSHVCAVK
jgi:hypothetical protein